MASPESSPSLNLVQQGAAAMRWVAKLGEFVQRRAAYVTQSRPGEHTTVMQEQTTWSPTARAGVQAETEPLFDRAQARRLHELTAGAPQLYGAVSQGGGSDSSASYTRDQLEQEVRRQVEQAMERQKEVMHENQQLRLELERLRKEVGEVLGAQAGTINGVSKAIQQDFQDTTVSKGVMFFSKHLIMYPKEIQEDREEILVYFVDMARVMEVNGL
ncbi:unnamed protein product, partial [Symbiodinium sp. CCMP2456]